MKVIAINGSPRKSWNTATLLQTALDGAKSVGASTEIIHLYDLNFKGCTSCFACKRKDNRHIGHCAMKDDLTSVLAKIAECNVLILGTPIYFANITGAMQSFLERLLFSNVTYNAGHGTVFKGKISSLFIYTMNVPKDIHTMNIPEDLLQYYNYEKLFQYYKQCCRKILNGTSELLLSQDTYQFDNYSNYESSMFDEKQKLQVKTNQFPIDCQKAFDMSAMLASSI